MKSSTYSSEGPVVNEDSPDEGDTPVGKRVTCPECDADAYAIVPPNTELTEREDQADGKVWVDCLDCEHEFLVYFRRETGDH